MCRNIKTLANFEPPATEAEISAAALQFIRKVSGYNKPGKVNENVFNSAVDDVSTIVKRLLGSLETTVLPKNRELEVAKARARNQKRFQDQRERSS